MVLGPGLLALLSHPSHTPHPNLTYVPQDKYTKYTNILSATYFTLNHLNLTYVPQDKYTNTLSATNLTLPHPT